MEDENKITNTLASDCVSTTPISKGMTPKSEGSPLSSSPLPPSVTRLWRQAAQRNVRNQWSKLSSLKQQWASSSSSGLSHATSFVNAHLSQKYVPNMQLGTLSDMPHIRKKARLKLFKQQELYQSKLLSSYKDMVDVVVQMINTSRSMRCYFKGSTSSPIVQFSSSFEDNNDYGDGGGIPVYTFWTIHYFEKLADELVQMFMSELSLKRWLLIDLLSVSPEISSGNSLAWSEELYPGEFDDLRLCDLYVEETGEPLHPSLKGHKSNTLVVNSNHQQSHEVLQVFLVSWLEQVNIHKKRVDEIFDLVGAEMCVTLS